ncbi:Mandelate racemase / muconate lactonizing enzyme, N-terminal domain [Microvirga guangxiensis]|uniref:Mandelate racemase / muconate lactonizing enzyme, N-terminal domain n=2 Tax=Microvirga guangxiensis TaxID=549386 RepID=A0A1G5KL78_9HYPH|nr:Mandelate racemase / muconate lactonizing enzyme, N-terminal domain [Microvirga guangxiensis]
MKITAVKAIPLEATFASIFGGEGQVPAQLKTPAAHFQRIPRKGQYSTLVIVEADDGSVGYGECFGLPHPVQATALINEVVAPTLIGASVGAPDAMTTDLRAYFYALGLTRGAAMEALSGVDIALWDLLARSRKQPLATTLGAEPGPVSVYVSPIPFRNTPVETVAEVNDFIRQGYKAFKLKVGRGVKVDLDHIEAARDAAGTAPLYLDANCAYDVDSAIELARHLDRFDIAWLEEPINPDNPEGLRAVRAASPVPIGAGENEFTQEAYQALIRAEAVDFLQCNIGRAGGVSGLIATGSLCRKHGLKLAPHGVGACVAVAASVHACRAAEAFVTYEVNRLINPLRDKLALAPIELRDGMLVASDRAGHGGEPNPDLLDTYTLHWQTVGQ